MGKCGSASTAALAAGKWREQQADISSIPPLGNRFFLALIIQFPLPGLWTLHKRTLLSMKLAKHTSCLSLIDHTSAFPPPTRITGTIFPASSIVIVVVVIAVVVVIVVVVVAIVVVVVVVVVVVGGRGGLCGCSTTHAG
jgi:hypothetical protein